MSRRFTASSSDSGENSKPADLDHDDATLLFEIIWEELVHERGLENMVFPKFIMWLAGAPGAGKSEMTPYIMAQQGIESTPIKLGEILTNLARDTIRAGRLVSDRQVLTVLLRKLLEPQYTDSGVLVDGFPRSLAQADAIKLLFDKCLWIRRHFEGSEHFNKFRRPVFHVTVLYVEEDVSVARQLERGQRVLEHNKLVEKSGVGQLMEVRNTDFVEGAARHRYREFQTQMYASLQVIKDRFPFHFINAEGSREQVQASILKELIYQSQAELADTTFDNVRRIPLASEIKRHARIELVKRLDRYQRDHQDLFDRVISILRDHFMVIVRRQALTGQVIIRSEDPIFFEQKGLGLNMALDLLSERGYRVVLDYIREHEPLTVDKESGEIKFELRKIFIFHISFPPPKIRHAVTASDEGWEQHIV